ncbi:hypothetical protein AB0D11_06525 [Streptomyces monashensis]|uniref:hypothetical protein n=1 Tax=Streptomyces monashensis TaxID=1678012 RepID=UPI0033DA4E6B
MRTVWPWGGTGSARTPRKTHHCRTPDSSTCPHGCRTAARLEKAFGTKLSAWAGVGGT